MRSRLAKVLLVLAFGSPLGQATHGLEIGDVVVTTKEMTSCLFVPGTGDAGEANQFWTIPAQSKLTVIGTRQEKQSWYKVSGDQWVEEKQLGGNYRLVYRANRAKPSGATPATATETEHVTKLSGAPGVHDTLVTTKPLTSYIHPNINPEVGNEVFIIPVKTVVDVLAIVRYRSNWCQLEVGEYSPRWIEEKELVGSFTPCPPEVIAERNRLREAENTRWREYAAKRKQQQAALGVQASQAQVVQDDPKGPKPYQSGWTGKVRCVTDYLKDNLNDPDVDYVDWSPVVEQGEYWMVRCKFRAKNALGASILCQWIFFIQNEQVDSYVEL